LLAGGQPQEIIPARRQQETGAAVAARRIPKNLEVHDSLNTEGFARRGHGPPPEKRPIEASFRFCFQQKLVKNEPNSEGIPQVKERGGFHSDANAVSAGNAKRAD
jgi:hypothetical protein